MGGYRAPVKVARGKNDKYRNPLEDGDMRNLVRRIKASSQRGSSCAGHCPKTVAVRNRLRGWAFPHSDSGLSPLLGNSC